MIVTQETVFLYRLTRFGMINCFLVKENNYFILIDTGLHVSGKPILRAAGKLGCRIKSIVLTHGHLDHVGSVNALMHSIPEAEFLGGSRESRINNAKWSYPIFFCNHTRGSRLNGRKAE